MAEINLNLNPSETDDEMFRKIVSAFRLPDQSLKSYGKDALMNLIEVLFHVIRWLLRKIAKQNDRLELLNFQAKKSSRTSSMKPSSDGYVGVGFHKVDPDTRNTGKHRSESGDGENNRSLCDPLSLRAFVQGAQANTVRIQLSLLDKEYAEAESFPKED